jgi:two-component system cell cycle sensor histidine kinase/response regulator CckA
MTAVPSDDARSGGHNGRARPGASLRFRFALTIVGVSAAVVASFGAVVHRQMSESATRGASEHLERAAREVANMLGGSAKNMLAAMAGVAADTDVVEFLRNPDGRRAEAAREALRRLSPEPGKTDVELWTASGDRTRASDSKWPEMTGAARASLMDLVRGSDATAVTPIALLDTTLVYEVVSRVGSKGSPLGYVVVRRRVMAPGGDGSAQLRAVVGSDALILLGNASGDIWTDMVRRVPMPPAARAASTVEEYNEPRLGPVFASMHRIANTPWSLVIEFPRATVLHEVGTGMNAIIIFGLAALLIAAVMSWRLSGEFTRPLEEMATAAGRISDGDYDRPLPVRGKDEIGAAASAFNRMASSLRGSRAELEAKVGEAASSARRLERVITSSGAVLYELAPRDGVMRFTWISENVADLLGYSLAEALAPGWWSGNVYPDDLTKSEPEAEPRTDGVREYRFRHKDGGYRWVRDDQRVVPDEASGRAHIVGTWLDITEQRHLEEQLRHAQKMEAIGTLAGGVAHDFNNILTVVTSYAELLSRTEDDPNRRCDLDEIVAAARRATLLTRQLLTFSRKTIAEPQSISVSYVVARLGGMLRRLLKENVKLVPRLSDDVAPILGDPNQLEQVVMNLVINAADAMPDGGTLVIETQNIELDDAYARTHGRVTPGRYVMLAVTDTGAGIDPSIMDKIYEPFFTTKPPGQGTGLGLASTYAIVKEAGGHIWVYSEPGQGTTFKVYFPWERASKASPSPSSTPSELRMLGTALLVEDDARVRRAVRRMLERIGFDVMEAPDGEAGLGVAAGHEGPIDVVVTDLMMPRLGGGAFARRLALSRPNVPVVFMSGYTDDAAFRRGLLESEYTFVQKPFTREHLEAAIARVTRKVRSTVEV